MWHVGDPIHFVLADGPRRGECRPGVIVRVQDAATGTAVLQVFTDGLADGPRFHDPSAHVTAREGEPGQPGRFHRQDRCGN